MPICVDQRQSIAPMAIRARYSYQRAMLAIVLPIIAFLTALLSGIFGMAGGMVLMGALVLLLPISAAFVTHGIIQIISNGWRAWLNRADIVWPIIGPFSWNTDCVSLRFARGKDWMKSSGSLV